MLLVSTSFVTRDTKFLWRLKTLHPPNTLARLCFILARTSGSLRTVNYALNIMAVLFLLLSVLDIAFIFLLNDRLQINFKRVLLGLLLFVCEST